MNLQKAIICFVSFWLSICHISAQQLSGKIVSREGNIIPYANVFCCLTKILLSLGVL